VIDGETGKELRRSLWELDKTDPDSWGSYYVESSGNYENVYWYYNLADTEHTWEVKYTMHGAISFMDEFDELYWDAIGNEFEKGVERVKVTVRIPEGASAGDLRFAMYGDHMTNAEVADARTFVFEAENVLPREYFTVAAGWPKGLIDEKSFIKDWFLIHWQGILAVALIPAFIIAWKIIIKRRKSGSRVIVPHYEPARGMKPAEVEYFFHGFNSAGSWSATAVDLAERGYVRIEEREPSKSEMSTQKIANAAIKIIIGIPAGMLAMFAISGIISIATDLGDQWEAIFMALPTLVAGFASFSMFRIVFGKGKISAVPNPLFYVIKRTDKKEGADISRYERILMEAMFLRGDFDLTAMRQSSESIRLSSDMALAGKALSEDFDPAEGLRVKRGAKQILTVVGLVFACFFGFIIVISAIVPVSPLLGVIIIGALITATILAAGTRYTEEGRRVRDELLGFKLYIETADKYRMQNLTPDLFGKYLAYAMIFGLEKEWAVAFEGINVSSPSWYAGSSSFSTSGGSLGFSSAAFTSGFSASFSSMFASATGTSSSGGGGGSGGGGSSGGGGGGGGGGAS